jgi:AcrR family transcriptional regulator
MQIESARRSNPERSAEMRARLIAAARALFVAEGYAATSTPALVSKAGVTRGALYHHFPDKQAVFRAVVEAESAAVADAIDAAEGSNMSAMERLLAGAKAYVQAMQVAGRVRLILIDGPAVLGQEDMQQIEGRHGDASLKIGLQDAMSQGPLPSMPLDTLSTLLSAMFERAAIEVAEGRDPAEVLLVLEQILQGLSRLEKGR